MKNCEVKAEMRQKCLLLKVDRHFNLAESASSSEIVLCENAMTDVSDMKHLQMTRSSHGTEETTVIEMNSFERDVALSMKATIIDANSTKS